MTERTLRAALERRATQLLLQARRADAERRTVRWAIQRLDYGDDAAAVRADLQDAGVRLPGTVDVLRIATGEDMRKAAGDSPADGPSSSAQHPRQASRP